MNNERTQNTSRSQDRDRKTGQGGIGGPGNINRSGTETQRTAGTRNDPLNQSGGTQRGAYQGGPERNTQNIGNRPQAVGGGRYQYSNREQYSNEGSSMAGIWAALIGIGAGVAAMYFLDPNRGARRRAIATDKLTSAGRHLPEAARVTARDLSNRARGKWAEATHLFSSDDPSDQVIEARVRSKIGRVCSHPHAIHVMSQDGHVTIDGVVLADEVPSLIRAVEGVRGVQSVENQLRQFSSPESIPSLQGGTRREYRSEFMQQNWSPAARIAAGAAGTAALASGLALLARSLTNTEVQRLVGTGGGRSAVTVDKTINVNAPPDVLYSLWSNFENFPKFMSNVLEVRNINDELSHWKVAGPAGIPVEWDAEITKVVPNELIAWKSVEGSTVANAGYVLFERNEDGSTEVNVRISYNPPAGAIGHAVAKVFGADPKTEMDQDLMRMKSMLETGEMPRDAAQPYTRNADRIH